MGTQRSVGSARREIVRLCQVDIAALMLEAYDLTPRERGSAARILGGRSTAEIAAGLCNWPLTVRQHLKAVFDTVGARSRRELIAQFFARHYKPRMLAGGRVGTDGWFATERSPGPPVYK